MGRFVDLSGQKLNRLTVVHRAENRGKDTMWKCVCDCGKEIVVSSSHLKSGHTKSCGCFRSEVLTSQGYKNATHKMKRTRLYRIWGGIKDRCCNPVSAKYADYGGRGIFVCPEWLDSFESFRDWALASGYAEGLSIDRKDNDGPYTPDNCRWVTMAVQSNNKRTSHMITFDGRSQTLTQWAEEVGVNPTTLGERLKRGWSIEKTLTTPVSRK